jgi:hypothetical protein
MTQSSHLAAAPAADREHVSASSATHQREWLAIICVLAGEAAVAGLMLRSNISPGTILAVHCAVLSWVWLILFMGRQSGADLTLAALILLLVAAAGPAGALAAAFMLAFSGRSGAGPYVLDRWYRRLASAGGVDPATAMHDRFVAGRVLRHDGPPPALFSDIIENGTLSERQSALGLIARRFHPDYSSALAAALRSPEPVVRVQAAAVVARVRADLKLKVAQLTAPERQTGAPAQAARLETATHLSLLSSCFLVDETERAVCRAQAAKLFELELTSTRTIARAAALAEFETAAALEGYLIGAGRLKEFRIARRVHDVSRTGLYRFRQISAIKGAA